MKEHDKIIKLQMELSKPFANKKPTNVTEIKFIYALNQTNIKTTERSGKWILYFNEDNLINSSWKKIKKNTEEGKLGVYSKVVTNAPGRPYKNKIICVFTYDYQDIKDVMKIRERLRELGFTQKISYKKDKDTLLGKYKNKGNKNISLFFC